MTGQIPPYGKHLRREEREWHPEMSSTVYVSKLDPRWYVRSDKTSHRWWVFFQVTDTVSVCVSRPQRTLKRAMELLVGGFAAGSYASQG